MHPDVVVLDINMSIMNGIEVLEELIRQQGKMPSIIVFAKEAIIMSVYDDNIDTKLKDIIKAIANKNMAVASCVYWNMNDTIKTMWKLCDRDFACKTLKINDNTKPSTEYVIEYLSMYYRKYYKKHFNI